MDISQSIDYILKHGIEAEHARMKCIIYNTAPDPKVVYSIEALQNQDGGFPCRKTKGYPSCINDTLNAFWQMDELGMLDSPTAQKTKDYLLKRQKVDGSWDEEPSALAFDLPPWAKPGDLKARIYLTAYSIFRLALGGDVNQVVFTKALEFLRKHQDETGQFYGFFHSTWIATGAFLLAGNSYLHVTQKGIQALMARPLAKWVDSQLCWALDCLGHAGLPKGHPFIDASLAELMVRRSPEGIWISEDGEAQTVSATIEALKVLKLFGCIEDNSSYLK